MLFIENFVLMFGLKNFLQSSLVKQIVAKTNSSMLIFLIFI